MPWMRQVLEFVMSSKTFVTLNSKFIKTWSMIHFQFIFFIHFKETIETDCCTNYHEVDNNCVGMFNTWKKHTHSLYEAIWVYMRRHTHALTKILRSFNAQYGTCNCSIKNNSLRRINLMEWRIIQLTESIYDIL